ncbi:unnamed protein product, partial [Ectocarpus sp. 8 AP-2014]
QQASTEQEQALARAKQSARGLARNLASLLDRQDYLACMNEAKRLLEMYEEEQRGRVSQQTRPLKFENGRMRPEHEEAIKPVGYIAQLGYVEDESLANLLSRKAGSKMKAVYVDTRRQLKMVREARAGGFCKETVAKFKVPRESRPRNAREIASGQLPLPKPTDKGFKGYLVNMIELPENQEHLRDTIFYALYGSMVMFDTLDNALNYQARCQ